ncbi:MAG: hypothetical protein ACLFRK_03280 [Candidatus Nanohaloarchaea archaeon]
MRKSALLWVFLLIFLNAAASAPSDLSDSELANQYEDVITHYDLEDTGQINYDDVLKAIDHSNTEGNVSEEQVNALEEAYNRDLNYQEYLEESDNAEGSIKSLEKGWQTVEEGDILRSTDNSYPRFEFEFKVKNVRRNGNVELEVRELQKHKYSNSPDEWDVISRKQATVREGETLDEDKLFSGLSSDPTTGGAGIGSCGEVQESSEKFQKGEVNIYYDSTSSTIVDGSSQVEEVGENLEECLAHRSGKAEKKISPVNGKDKLFFQPQKEYSLDTGNEEITVNFGEVHGGINSLSGYMTIGDETVYISTGEDYRLESDLYMEIGEAAYNPSNRDERFFEVKIKPNPDQYHGEEVDLLNWDNDENKYKNRKEVVATGNGNVILEGGDTVTHEGEEVFETDWCLPGSPTIKGKIYRVNDDVSLIIKDFSCHKTRIRTSDIMVIDNDKADTEGIDKAPVPQASLEFDSNVYETGEEAALSVETETEGDYSLEISGAGIDRETTVSGDSKTIDLEPSKEGELTAKLTAKSGEWLILRQDKTVAEASSTVSDEKPDASLDSEKDEYTTEDRISLRFQPHTPGKYELSVEGPEISESRSYTESDSEDSMVLEPSKEGEINVELVAPGGWWVLGSDKVVDSKTIKIDNPDTVEWNEEVDPKTGEEYELPDGSNVEVVTMGRPGINSDQRMIQIRTDEGLHDIRTGESTDEAARSTEGFIMHYCQRETSTGYMVFTPSGQTDTQKACEGEQEPDTGDYTLGEVVEVEKGDVLELENGDTLKIDGFVETHSPPTIMTELAYTSNGEENTGSGTIETRSQDPTTVGPEENRYWHTLCNINSEEKTAEIIVDNTQEINCQEEDDQKDSSEEPANNEPGIELSDTSVKPGTEVPVETQLPERQAEKGYKLTIDDPEGETVWEETGEKPRNSYQVQTQDWKPGDHNIKLKPSGGLVDSIIGSITGSETFAEKTVTVSSPEEEAWKTFCQEQDYSSDSIDQQISCIRDEIVPQYFEDSEGENVEVAESLCQNLLEYSYEPGEKACRP